ncbi:unnamed protein product [Auanema sp. JU1783]|nr:unnamed protein product [Auanema sp. JU1783]
MAKRSSVSPSPSTARNTAKESSNGSENNRQADQSRSNSRGASNQHQKQQTSTPPVGSEKQKNENDRLGNENLNQNSNAARKKTPEVHVLHKLGRQLSKTYNRTRKRGSVINGVYCQHANHYNSTGATSPSDVHNSTHPKAKSYWARAPNLYKKGNRNETSLPNTHTNGRNNIRRRGRTLQRNKETKKVSISMERTNEKYLEMKKREMNKDVEWNRQFLPKHHYVYTDGSWKTPNLGGVGIYHGPNHVLNRSFKVDKPNVYLCEINAIKTALQDLVKHEAYKSQTIVVRTDCLESIKAVRTLIQNNTNPTDIHELVSLCYKFPKGVCIEHVYAHDTDIDYGNLAADMLARMALNESNAGNSHVRDRSLDKNRTLSKNNNVDLIETHRVFVGGQPPRSNSKSSRNLRNNVNNEASTTDVPSSYTGSTAFSTRSSADEITTLQGAGIECSYEDIIPSTPRCNEVLGRPTRLLNIPATTGPSFVISFEPPKVPDHRLKPVLASAKSSEDSLADSRSMNVFNYPTKVKEPMDCHQSNNDAIAPDTGSSIVREVTDARNSQESNDETEEHEDCLTKCLMFFKTSITSCCKSKQ